MNLSEKIGTGSGFVATLTLGTLHLWMGLVAGFFTILCLIPNAIKNWRELRRDYTAYLVAENDKRDFWSFFSFCIGRIGNTKDNP